MLDPPHSVARARGAGQIPGHHERYGAWECPTFPGRFVAACGFLSAMEQNGSSVKFVGKLWLGKLAKRMI